jgi:hypothetical protein
VKREDWWSACFSARSELTTATPGSLWDSESENANAEKSQDNQNFYGEDSPKFVGVIFACDPGFPPKPYEVSGKELINNDCKQHEHRDPWVTSPSQYTKNCKA